MKKTEKMNVYKAEYNRIAYDRLSLYIPKGEKDEIKNCADSIGESVNAFIYRAIVERMEKLTTKPDAKADRKPECNPPTE